MRAVIRLNVGDLRLVVMTGRFAVGSRWGLFVDVTKGLSKLETVDLCPYRRALFNIVGFYTDQSDLNHVR